MVGFVRTQTDRGRHVIVLLAQVKRRRRRYTLLYNQRGIILAAALRVRSDAVVATLAVRVDERTAGVGRPPAVQYANRGPRC